MKVEQENFLRAILRSVQRRRRRSGTRRCMARAKSAFITIAPAFSTPCAVRTPTARRPSKRTSSTGVIETDLNAEPFGHARHRCGHRGATADRMEHAVFVFEERENREQARAAERRHAEIFRLKGKRQADARVAKKASEISVDRLMRAQHRKHFQQPHIDQVLPAEERCFKTRLHAPELGAIFVEETAETWRVARRDRGDLLFHARDVRCRV